MAYFEQEPRDFRCERCFFRLVRRYEVGLPQGSESMGWQLDPSQNSYEGTVIIDDGE